MSSPSAGRRVATRRRPRPRPRPGRGAAGAAGLVVAGVLLLVGGGLVHASPSKPARPTRVPVENVDTACLGWPKGASSQGSTLAAPLTGVGHTSGGQVTVGPVGQKATVQPSGARGELRSLEAARQGGAVALNATGGAAVGRATFQTDRAEGSGIALQDCLPPSSRWWFTGGGAGLDHRSQLVMANVDPGPAVVDVVVQSRDGVAQDVGTRGMTIAPGQVKTIDLIDIAPQADELQVHVAASRGRVVAGIADEFATAPAATPGREWLPGQSQPARVLKLAPLPRVADKRTLVVANPSDNDALVQVHVAGASGSFVPTGLDDVRVPAQSVVTEDLGSAVGHETSAVVLQSDVPVTAAVRSTQGRDVSYAGPVPTLDGPAAAVLEKDADATVQLSAGKAAGRARITAYSAAGQPVGSTELKIPADATAGWTAKRGAAYLVVTPVQGLLWGGVSESTAAGVSQVGLRPLPVTLERPVVVPVVR